jgi:hypothetical protein
VFRWPLGRRHPVTLIIRAGGCPVQHPCLAVRRRPIGIIQIARVGGRQQPKSQRNGDY